MTDEEKLKEALYALIAIKHLKVNVPPERSYGDWTTRKLLTLKDVQKYARDILNALEYKKVLLDKQAQSDLK